MKSGAEFQTLFLSPDKDKMGDNREGIDGIGRDLAIAARHWVRLTHALRYRYMY